MCLFRNASPKWEAQAKATMLTVRKQIMFLIDLSGGECARAHVTYRNVYGWNEEKWAFRGEQNAHSLCTQNDTTNSERHERKLTWRPDGFYTIVIDINGMSTVSLETILYGAAN